MAVPAARTTGKGIPKRIIEKQTGAVLIKLFLFFDPL